MRFEVLGRLAVWDGSTELDIPGAKQRVLLAYLLVNGGRLVPADRIIEDLWGDAAPSKARNALQAKVSSLRRALAPADAERGRRLLEARDGGYRISADEDTVDADRFAGLVARARGALEANHPARAYALLEQALALWGGEPLPEHRDYPFAAAAADRYRALWLNAVEMHATAWLAVGGRPGLPDELAKVLAEHPLRESLRALLMRALARQARQVEALQVYRAGRRLLRDELGIDPGAELESAHADVFAQHDQVAPVADTGHGPAGWLPAESTEFIGRGPQRQHLQDLLARERLVTVTGPGGIGKTRLVVHTLTRLTEPAEGVWFTDLGSVAGTIDCPNDSATIADTVLRTFRDRQGANLGSDERLTTDSRRGAVERLRDRIGSREMVLVLDGGEHVVAEVAELAGYLLAACPELRLVVTTRVLLGLAGEAVLRLEPLALPPVEAARKDYLAAESVALFCTRAGLDAEALSEAAFGEVAAIVRRTDGIPLAMEVAAGLLGGLTLSDLAAHLRADQDFLQHGSGSTLIETIERSWRLLGEQERDLLARLSLIEGSWGLDAAHALAPDGVRGGDLARPVDRVGVAGRPRAHRRRRRAGTATLPRGALVDADTGLGQWSEADRTAHRRSRVPARRARTGRSPPRAHQHGGRAAR
ncbi:DNA-binding transcriptional activator of the SARP family [Haloechinothrix alba]|uniref:DNA-binding transcriptional activator of the SARP family n=1 Tax=Haloechinothrix alba TaxID=664784 RepID=A0A238X2F3_9PSEU|nr:BTAD domain-containing putative transcriptional regulator [Haloechinothrix alba]SNR52604.1 DNA-binding transcriptional activator of the SARP family [Haloechinothrix alba]